MVCGAPLFWAAVAEGGEWGGIDCGIQFAEVRPGFTITRALADADRIRKTVIDCQLRRYAGLFECVVIIIAEERAVTDLPVLRRREDRRDERQELLARCRGVALDDTEQLYIGIGTRPPATRRRHVVGGSS